MTAPLLHLLRHGAPRTPGLLLGHSDAAPAPAGIRQCLQQAEALDFAAIISSDLRRAAAPAAQIAAARRLPLVQDRRWRELNFGDWDGQPAQNIAPERLRKFYADPDAAAPPNGERWGAFVARVTAAIDALPDRNTLVVCHGGAMRAALHILCGLPRPQLFAFALPYAALLTIRRWPAGGEILALRQCAG